ncbi:hypothetical protein SERLADRAFT_459239 [Serpula lacrymans var. lacrymans S7.9]|uniref:Uncharacterized protein n=1 Tax=Serpula lacrymans var. lacrymans (strain S7.9) TaxID=578457 RepID=F8NLQ9_SERL9|nr:uncharacterized protein SERLADRAFT_459239 [Serpula lacrymans var. lacrymans S7.9]EGO28611.1 hypothetical protein SERLADRAFT_459239 [Serpula lacrymans var. lacrymans S7.9]
MIISHGARRLHRDSQDTSVRQVYEACSFPCGLDLPLTSYLTWLAYSRGWPMWTRGYLYESIIPGNCLPQSIRFLKPGSLKLVRSTTLTWSILCL